MLTSIFHEAAYSACMFWINGSNRLNAGSGVQKVIMAHTRPAVDDDERPASLSLKISNDPVPCLICLSLNNEVGRASGSGSHPNFE